MDGSTLCSRTSRRGGVLIGLLALLLCGVLAGAAQAIPLSPTDAALPGSNFQGGDGDQDAENGLNDWESLVGSMGLVSTSDPNADDSIFDTGSHENDPLNWDISSRAGGSTPAKANFFNSWTYVDDQDDTFLYVAFNREVSGGNVFLAFELNQDTRRWLNASDDLIPCRTEGDLIVSYEIQNDDDIDVIIQRWISDSEVSAAEAAAGFTNGEGCSKTGHFDDIDLSVDEVQGAINTGRTIENFLPGGPEPSIGEELFGEAALNLTAIFEDAGLNPCFSFGQISLHGRASESDSASMQDLVGPVPLLVRSCTAEGVKYHDLNGNGNQDAGEPGLEGFRIWADYDNDGVLDAGEPFDDTDADGDYLITGIDPPDGDYSLREKLTAGDGTDGWICSEPVTTLPNGPFPCAYLDIDVDDDPVVVGRDFGNYKQATITVEKQTVPDGETALFDFTLDGQADFDLSDGQSADFLVDPGTYVAEETLHPDFNLTDVTCSGDEFEPDSVGDTAAHTGTFEAQSGEELECVFTNTRKTGRLTVEKDLIPSEDPGKFDLKIGDETVVTDGGDGASNFRILPTGDYDVSELAGTGTSLGDYNSKVVCTNGQANDPGTSLDDVHVTENSDITCTFTNTRKTGKLTVEKDLISSLPDEHGLFDLRIGDETVVDDGGDGASASRVLPTGDYDVSELGGTGTSLGDYNSKVVCSNQQANDPGTSLDDVHVTENSDITCVFTNTRKTGRLTVEKDLISALPDESGLFDLRIGDETVVDDGGDGASASKILPTGDYDVSELGGTGTSLGDYKSKVVCSNQQANDPGTSLDDVHVTDGSDITCVFTNTRKTGRLTVEKDLIPAEDAGKFDLSIGAEEVVTDGGDGASASRVLPIGDYDIAEAAGTGTSLDDYDSRVECTNDQENVPGTSLDDVHVTDGSDITCTFTNTRLATVKITKNVVWAGTPTDAEFDYSPNDGLSDNSDPAATDFQLADGETETIARVLPNDGSGDPYSVTEAVRPGFRIGSVDCDDDDSTGSAATGIADIVVSAGETVTCTYVNEQISSAVLVVKEGPATVFHGDQITYTFTVTNAGNSPLHDVTVADDRCEPVVLQQKNNSDGDDVLENAGTPDATESESWVYTCTTTIDAEHSDDEEDPIVNTVTATGKDEEDNPVTDTDTHTTDILHPTIDIDKKVRIAGVGEYVDSGLESYVGDTLEYQFTVTSPPPGDVGLAVSFADPRCDAGTLTGPAGDDGDALLEPGETWVYGCTHVITAADPDPLPNTARVTGQVPETDKTVEDEDSSSVDILHPAIDIEKSGPAEATAGDVLSYSLAVTNPGDVEFASDQVVVTDPGCDDQPALASKNGDPTPDFLNPGDNWTYTCSHATAAGQTSFLNVANVTGKDRNGREVTDTDDLPTLLNQQAVLPEPEIINGAARLRGPSGCVKGPFRATVRGSRIARVTFFVDGKRFRRINAPNGEGTRFTVKINPRGRGFGVHRVTARVEFASASQTQTRTLRLSFQRCRKQVVRPRFTG